MNAAAASVSHRLCVDWLAERRKLDMMVTDAAVSKTRLPDNYWVAEHRARRLLAIADVLAEELPDEI